MMRKIRAKKRGQAAIEYLLIAAAVALAVVATNSILRMRNQVFEPFFNKAVEAMR